MESKADSDSNTLEPATSKQVDSDSQHYQSTDDQSSDNKPKRSEASRKKKIIRDKTKRAELSELFKELGGRVGVETQKGKRNPDRTNIMILKETLKHFDEAAGPSKVIQLSNEYRTQHRLNGIIVEVDERIELVAGYSMEEVLGTQAYAYIYPEHVPHVDIDLRKMLVYHQGTTVYQLKTKKDKWIFLRSEGAVDMTTLLFDCTNTILTEEQGQREIHAIREKYSAWMGNKNEAPTNYTLQPMLPLMGTTVDGAASSQQQHYLVTLRTTSTPESEPIVFLRLEE